MTAASELKQLGQIELEGRLAESRRELLNLRFQLATGQLDNSSRLRETRKDVARILTVLREREFEQWEGPAPTGPARERPATASDDAAATAPMSESPGGGNDPQDASNEEEGA